MLAISNQFSDPELEKSILTALSRDADAYWRYAEDYLTPEIFSDPLHRRVFLSLQEYHSGHSPMPELLTANPPPDLDIAVTRLIDLAQRRKATEILIKFWSDLGTGKPVQNILIAAVEKLTEAQQVVKALTPGDVLVLTDLLAQAEADLAEKTRLLRETGRSTAHPSFGPDQKQMTELLGGLQPGIYALGGQPNVGKTFLALNWAYRYLTAERDTGVVWVDTNETRPIHLLAVRLACVHARRNPYEFERLLVNSEEFTQIANQARLALGGRFVVLEASANTTVAHIRGAVRRLKANLSVKKVMVVVDYIQKMAIHTAIGGNYVDYRQKVISAVAALTELVKLSEGPVVVISSLSKDAYRRGVKDNEASIADYKEAGEVEYTADVGIQLRWAKDERNYDKDCAVKVLDLWVVKNRFGPTGVVRVFSNRLEARYTEEDPGHIKIPALLREFGQSESVEVETDGEDLPF
ncbi:MAG: DNA helicase [Firmicutes bacterium]|nr:DNA helicase [Bacillota bacterium]